MATDMWLCETCRSLNRVGSAKCYSCGRERLASSPTREAPVESVAIARPESHSPRDDSSAASPAGRPQSDLLQATIADERPSAAAPTSPMSGLGQAPAARFCAACAAPLSPGARFCAACAAPVGPEPATPNAAACERQPIPAGVRGGLLVIPSAYVSQKPKPWLVGTAVALFLVGAIAFTVQQHAATPQPSATPTDPNSCSLVAPLKFWTTDVQLAPYASVTVHGADAHTVCGTLRVQLPTDDLLGGWKEEPRWGGGFVCSVHSRGDVVTVESSHGDDLFAQSICDFVAAR
jgi:hypothetical protein